MKILLNIFFVLILNTVFSQTNIVNDVCLTTLSSNSNAREINAVFYDEENGKVYIGGNFSPIHSTTFYCGTESTTKNLIARYNFTTGSYDTWNPNPNNSKIIGNVTAICRVSNTVLVAGAIQHSTIGPIPLPPPFYGMVGLDATTGSIVSTYTISGGNITSMIHENNLLIIAGTFTAYNGIPCPNKIVVIDTNTNQLFTSFSNTSIYNPYGPNINPGNNGEIKEVKVIGGRILAIAKDPSILMNSILDFDITNLTVRRRLSILSNNYEFNSFCDDNDSLFIFPSTTDGFFGNQCIRVINNVDVGPNPTLLPANLKNWFFGFKLFPSTGVTAVFTRTIDAQAFPPSYSNLSYSTTPLDYIYNKVILSGNKFLIASSESENSFVAYKAAFYKNGTVCADYIDENNLLSLTQGNFGYLKKLFTHKNLAFALRKTHTSTLENTLEYFCVLPRQPLPPSSVGGGTVFCPGNTYTFTFKNPSIINNFNWGYTGTGAIFQNSNNDTVVVKFSQNATNGKIFVRGTSGCNLPSDTGFTQINFIPPPQITAKIEDTLNCYNNFQKVLLASSSTSSVTIHWYAPSSPTTAVFSSSVIANATGVYTTVVTQTVTGCSNTSTTNVISDTELLPILNVNLTYTAMCDPNSVLLFAQNCMSPPCYDSLYWMIGNTSYSNPLIYTPINPSNVLVAKNKNIRNGCINSFTTTVYKNTTVPSYTLNVPVFTPSVGLPEFSPITCSNDSVFLSASSFNSNVFWKIPGNDTLPNNCYVDTSGVYQLIVKDTINGCVNNSFLALLPTDLNPPQLSLNNSFALLNCSFNTATLQAGSLSPSTSISWVSPVNSFTSSNPATANQQGWYYAIATSASNGCERKDSINLVYSNTLYLNTSNDTTICYGSSVNLFSNPVGGIAPISYTWTNNQSNGSNALYVSNTFTNVQIVKVIDNLGCTGIDTIKINVPKQLTDSVATFKSCNPNFPTGQIQVYPKGGIAPYYYSINNGLTFQTQPIFSNLNFGSYNLIIKDSLGCLRNTSATISANSFVPKIDFILNTTMMQQDTFVMVDISNPRPDSIKWTVPSNITLLNGPFVNSPILVCGDTGSFYIKAKAYFNNCIDSLTKLVRFIKYDSTAIKSGINNGIKTFSLYPNPNTGQFTVYLEFFKNQTFVIKIISASGGEVFQSNSYNGNSATIPVQMPVNTPGNYYLRVIAEFDSKQKSFILTN